MNLPRRKAFLFVFSLLLLFACQIPAAPGLSFLVPTASQTPTATTTQTFTPTASATPTLTATPTDTPSPTLTPTFTPSARRVIILSIDGLRPDAILLAPMPNLLTLMQSGATAVGAQTVFPSITLVAHASMLGGVCPSKHGVFWNEYEPERGYAQGTDLFDLAHAAGVQTIMYVGKEKFRHITAPSSLDTFIYINNSDSVLMGSLIANFPQDFGVLFIHLLATDIAGHESNWMSPYQLSVIREADAALGMLLEELDARNLRDETLIIVTADHGGLGGAHGSDAREDMTIPWIAAGPGIQPKTLTTVIHTMDTAATAAFALGLSIPPDWDGVPVYEAFGLPVERQSVQCQ
jgi:predicted AlkP superfamily pyrophosphatase or phosphodiesterase